MAEIEYFEVSYMFLNFSQNNSNSINFFEKFKKQQISWILRIFYKNVVFHDILKSSISASSYPNTVQRSAFESSGMKFLVKIIFMMTWTILPHLLRICSVIEEGLVTQNIAKTKRKKWQTKIFQKCDFEDDKIVGKGWYSNSKYSKTFLFSRRKPYVNILNGCRDIPFLLTWCLLLATL